MQNKIKMKTEKLSFSSLGLSEETLRVLKKQGIETPTEIQSRTIPLALEGRDVIAASATGSGKTLAFASSIVEKLSPNGKIQALVLTPTRELAEQVSDSIKLFASKRLNILSVYGGVPIENQMRRIKGSDVVVGTPGRILDLISRNSLKLRNIKVLILDEFDRMLDMGFHKDVDKIISEAPKERQTLLFSATTSGVEHLLDRYTNNAAEVTVNTYVDHSKLKQVYYDTPSNVKFSLLVHLLREEEKQNSGLVIVFCSTRRNADFVVENLNLNDINAAVIHGGLEQKKRMKVLKEFNDMNSAVLVCTDVAARGLDIKGVSHVYNYDMPQLVDDYVHRVGRTARAGENGIAINILTSRDYSIFSDIINQKEMNVEEMPLPHVKRAIMDKTAGQSRQRGVSRLSQSSKGFRTNNDEGSNSRSRRRSSEYDTSDKEMFDAVCKKCGKKCKVPFKPRTGVGVSCSECFVPKGENSTRGRNSNSRLRSDSNSNKRGSPGRKSDSRKRDDSRRGNGSRGGNSNRDDSRRGDGRRGDSNSIRGRNSRSSRDNSQRRSDGRRSPSRDSGRRR